MLVTFWKSSGLVKYSKREHTPEIIIIINYQDYLMFTLRHVVIIAHVQAVQKDYAFQKP